MKGLNVRQQKDIRRKSYYDTLQDLRSRMSISERVTSEVIHNQFLESVSQVFEKTIASPMAVLMGSSFAFIGVLALYAYARFIGLALSGSETIIMFLCGWILGIAFDLIRSAITRRS